jgi:hypothetical protein
MPPRIGSLGTGHVVTVCQPFPYFWGSASVCSASASGARDDDAGAEESLLDDACARDTLADDGLDAEAVADEGLAGGGAVDLLCFAVPISSSAS